MLAFVDVALVALLLTATVCYLGWVLFGYRGLPRPKSRGDHTPSGGDDCCGPPAK